jgi:hypothetical protein
MMLLESKWPNFKPIEDPDFKYELLEDFEILLPKDDIRIKTTFPYSYLGCKNVSLTTEYDEDWFSTGRKLVIKAGYRWDGPSGPTLDLPTWMRGPLVHDGLYSLGRAEELNNKDRKWADEMMYVILLQDNLHTHKTKTLKETFMKLFHNCCVVLKSTTWYYGVRIFGKSSFTNKNKKKKW